MALFDFKSDIHFVTSSDKLTLHIYQLNKNANPSSIRKAHWSEIAVVVPGRDNDDDDNNYDYDEEAVETKEYSGLVFFDGHGEIQEPAALTKLAQELTRLRLMVSPEGYCYQNISEFDAYKDFGIHYLRLNDTFDWSRHGVDLATTTVWRRSKLRYHVPKQDKETKNVGGGSVSKEKYEELKKLMKEKEEELEKVTEEKDEAEEELQRLKEEKQSEMEELKNEKDKELRKLKKERDRTVQKKDEELRKLRKEKEDKNDDDDDVNGDTTRVEKVREEKDEELRKLRKEKDDEIAKLVKDKDEELRKAREEIEKLTKERDEEVEKLVKSQSLTREADLQQKLEIDEELQKLKNQSLKREADLQQKLKIEKEKEEELQKLKNQSLKTEADLQQKLEICVQRSWSMVLTTRNLSPAESSHEEKKQFHLKTRRPVPPETFEVFTAGAGDIQMLRHYTPEIKEGSNRLLFETYEAIANEKETTATAWWPTPPKVDIGTSDGRFDTRNWWFAKTCAPEGGLTMVAYYDGDFNSVTVSGTTFSQPTIPLPYSKGAAFCPLGRTFVIGGLPVGFRLAFVYRD